MTDNMKFSFSFTQKLCFFILSSVILTFIATLTYNYFISKRIIIENLNEESELYIQNIKNQINTVLSSEEHLTRSLKLLFERGDLTTDELLSCIKKTVESDEVIYGCAIALESPSQFNGVTLYSPYFYRSGGEIKYIDLGKVYDNYMSETWYKKAKSLPNGIWCCPYYGKGGKEMMITYSLPCYRVDKGENKLIGIVTSDITTKWLKKFISKINIYKDSKVFLLSESGDSIAFDDRNRVLDETVLSFAREVKDGKTIINTRKMDDDDIGFEMYYSKEIKDHCFIYYTIFQGTGWIAGIIIPEEKLLYDLKKVTFKLIFIGLAGYLATLVIIILLTRKITLPLRKLASAVGNIGKADFHTEIPGSSNRDEIGVLSRSIKQMQKDLALYINNLRETTAAKEKIESELFIAKEIQQSLLPHDFPTIPQIQLFATLNPAKAVGGDVYDFFFIDDKRFCFAMGDVSGKGVPAALLMAIIKTLLRSNMHFQVPSMIISKMNEEMCKENYSSMYVTFFLGMLDISTGELTYCNAGHNPPILCTKGKCSYMESGMNIILGFRNGYHYTDGSCLLSDEDMIFTYTDGITEAKGNNQEFFGEDKLLKIISDNSDKNPDKVISAVNSALVGFMNSSSFDDDVAMLALKYSKAMFNNGVHHGE